EAASDSRTGGETGRRIGFATFGAHAKLFDGEPFALKLGRILDEFSGFAGGHLDRPQIAVAFDAEPGDRFAGLFDLLDDALSPFRFDADNDRRGDVRIAAAAGERAGGQLQVLTEVPAAIGVG